MQPLCSPFASFPPLRPPHFHSWGRETSLSCSFARDRLKKAPEAVFPAPGIRALRKMSKHLKKKSEGASLANRPVCSPPLCRLVPLSILLEICVGQGVCFAPRALARQIARSALGRLSVVPNLAAIVFRLVVAERASFACVFFFPLARSYLSELLLDKGYVVHGLKRRASSYNHPRIEHIMDSSEFFVFVLEAPNRVQKRESLFFFAHRNSTNKKYRLPRLGALLPPLRRPDRLWLALPAAQVRGKKEERERKGAYFEGEKWLFFRAISFSSRESDAAADDKRQRNSKS